MAKGPRDYEVGTERALYRLSRGTCYFPECETRILTLVKGHAISGVQIAHIRGATPNGARYDSGMTDQQRAAFPNLMLMCVTHHNLIDRLEPENYPVEVLEQWKRDNEPDEGINTLDERLSEAKLLTILEDFAASRGLVREVEVSLKGGLITHRDGVASMPLDEIPILLEHNPSMATLERVVLADIRNVGGIDAVIDAVDFSLFVRADRVEGLAEASFLGRNDFPGSNPPLPYRLQDGASVQWYMKVSSVLIANETAGLDLVELSANVRLGSGERISSERVTWPKGLTDAD